MPSRRLSYEQQAMLSVVLAAVGLLCTLAGTFLMLQNFRWEEFQVVYSTRGLRMPAIMGALLVGIAMSGAGALLGFLSAGQRLNKKNNISWTGFFLSAGVGTLALCAVVFFWLTKYGVVVRAAIPGS